MSTNWDGLVAKLNLDVIERIDLPSREEVRLPTPRFLLDGPLSSNLAKFNAANELWSHQAEALDLLNEGQNVVVATGTASGKSLIFQLRALDLVKRNPKTKILVFYPLKALASDQYQRWCKTVKDVGLPSNCVARIDGDIPTFERNTLLENANIVLMTPDVCQAWFMRGVGGPAHRAFLSTLALIVLDEAHVYESVFGSNVAMLLRRLLSAHRSVQKAQETPLQLQLLAATATISEPAAHMEELTGRQFSVVSEASNGAPQFERTILHINGAAKGSAGEAAVTSIVKGLKDSTSRHRFIAFVDSRQGTERVALAAESNSILPYRSGYESTDRASIEKSLRNGKLDGVISTSALELGIDIPDMEVGITLGVPNSRKAFRQRIGRVGRSAPGLFMIIAPPTAFLQFGETFREYFESSVEPSYLYTGNRFIQFAHARCLFEELDVLGQEKNTLPAGVRWPSGFDSALRFAKPGGGRPREFDLVAQLGADEPHYNYPLRQVGEATFELKAGKSSEANRIGSIASNQAIRETYPGANYLHLGSAFKVTGWSTTSFERAIRIEPALNWVPTSPILRKTVTLGLDHLGVIEGRIKRCTDGIIAEVQLAVNEAVEGYNIGRTPYLYRDLRVQNPNLSRKQRDIRTSGIIIRVDQDWFSGGGGSAAKNREAIATALKELLCRERSITPSDIDFAHTNIAVMTDGAPRRVTNAIVVYDTVYGGLRLTEDLYQRFDHYVAQLDRAASMAGNSALVSDDVTEIFKGWAEKLAPSDVIETELKTSEEGHYMVYKPNSRVGIYHQGVLMERTIISPKLLDLMGDGQKQLVYIYEHNGRKTQVAHEEIQQLSGESSFIFWNSEEDRYHELDGDDQSTIESAGRFLKIYRPGSIVLVRRHGVQIKRSISTPKVVKDENGIEFVQYEYSDDNGTGLVPHDQIQTTGADWSFISWDPIKDQLKELS